MSQTSRQLEVALVKPATCAKTIPNHEGKQFENSDLRNRYDIYCKDANSGRKLFHKKAFIGPIHCICFSKRNNSILYAGIGPNLHIFDSFSGKELCTIKIFDHGGIIKGIKFFEQANSEIVQEDGELHETIIVFGQKRLKVVNLDIKYNLSIISHRVVNFGELCDWILDVMHMQTINNVHYLAVGYAHNFVQILHFDNPTLDGAREEMANLTLLKTFRSYPNCLLYSMSLFNSNPTNITNVEELLDSLLIASGTVFNQVIVWNKTNNTKENVITLNGHDGVIFNVEWSKKGTSLCSTSDDRTLRLWKFTSVPFSSQEPPSIESIPFFGHTARVWHCKFVDDFIISASEDTTIRVWDYSGNCLSTLQGHIGRNVWRVDVDSKQQIIASGGGDSSVKLWSLKRIRDFAILHNTCTLPGMDSSINKNQADTVRCMTAYNNLVYVGTQKGLVYKIEPLTGSHSEIFNANNSTLLGSRSLITVVKCSPCGKYGVLGTSEGRCTIIDLRTNLEVVTFNALNSRILSIFWVENSDTTFTIYFSSPLGSVKGFNFQPHQEEKIQEGVTYIIKGKVQSFCAVRDENIILTGDAKGFIQVLRSYKDETGERMPEFVLKNAHAEEQVCDIKFINRETIYSVGRDGTICFYNLTENDGKLTLIKHNSERLKHIIPILDKIYIIKKEQDISHSIASGGCDFIDTISLESYNKMDCEIILLGFYGSHFIVYNYTKRFRIASCYCGASRGIYDFVYSNIYETVQLCFSASFFRDSQVQTFSEKAENSVSLFKNQTPFIQFHGREVLNMTQWKNSNGFQRFVTSSEDTKIRLLSFEENDINESIIPAELDTLAILNGHESSVKELLITQVPGQDDRSRILISGGGKEQLILWKIEEKEDDECIMITTDILLNVSLTKQYLRVFHPQIYEDFLNREQPFDNSKTYLMKNKTRMDAINFRILSLDAYSSKTNEGELIVLTGSSDGLIKIFSTQNSLKNLKPLAYSVTHTGPVMSMASMMLKNGQRLIFSGSTNGSFYVFKLPIDEASFVNSPQLHYLQPIFGNRVHQSGVNCMHVRLVESQNEEMIYVCTGGDDQSVNLTVLKSENDTFTIVSDCHIEGVHSAAVSGVFTNGGSTIVSVSIDQRLNEYYIKEGQWEIVGSCMSEVADIADMNVVEEESHYQIVLVGAGMQIINLVKH